MARISSFPLFAKLTAACLLTLLLLSKTALAADQVASTEAAITRFGAACDAEISKAVSPETLKRIRTFRESPFLMVARKSHLDITDFLDPKIAAAVTHNDLFGSYNALSQSTGDVWVITYGNMSSLTVYLDATSGAILCVAFVPEG